MLARREIDGFECGITYLKLRTADFTLQIANLKLRTANSTLQIADSMLQIDDL